MLSLAPYTAPLARTPAVLRAVVSDVPDDWLDRRHAPDVVSPRETVAHLLLCEAEESWIDRLRNVRRPGTGWTAGEYAGLSDAELAAKPLPTLLDEFETWRGRNLQALGEMGLTEEDLARSITEDGFGTQTVGNVLATWVAHDLYHLGQVFKSYAAPYEREIGPYQRFLNLPHFN